MQLSDDTTEYTFGVKAQQARIRQAIKDHQWGKITQGEMGAIIEDCAKKLQRKQATNQNSIFDGNNYLVIEQEARPHR